MNLPLRLLTTSKNALAETIFVEPNGEPASQASAAVDLLNRLQVIVSAIAGIVAVGVVLYGAFLYLTSGGDEQKAAKAKKVLTMGLVGAFIILGAQVFIVVFIRLLGGGTA